MHFDEYGNRNNPTLLMLHGAFFVDTFSSQYHLADKYHLVVPHLKGFGMEASEVFDVESNIEEIVEICNKFGKLVVIGFSVGAQLTFKLVSEYPDLFKGAIIISPWVINKEHISDKIMNGSLKMFRRLQDIEESKSVDVASGMTKEDRADLVETMQQVSEDTIRNTVDNKISLKTVEGFEDIEIPTMVIVGGKEGGVMISGAKELCDLNENCEQHTLENAKHNIPHVYSEELDEFILEFLEGVERD